MIVDTATPTKKARVCFVHSPDPNYSELQNGGVLFMPLWAYTLAAHFPPNTYETDLADLRLRDVEQRRAADIFLFSGINQDFSTIVAVRRQLKKRFPAAKFIIGGPICWSFDQVGDIGKLSEFDHIVIGDGENIVSSLVSDLLIGRSIDHVIRIPRRFEIGQAKPVDRLLLSQTINDYYGAVVEVSRGCPFLCEFCDIRILPDNNRPHNKNADLIVEEVTHLSAMGVDKFLFACDNFIGDPRWAEELVNKLLAWQASSGYRPSFYTWLTINLNKYPELMAKMRKAGFDIVFIGIESFNSNSLLETAKVQNTAGDLIAAIRTIQSYGFFIVGGLIFGFDSDRPDCFRQTFDGILQTGLLSGDPSLLTALPGTPLYRRMKLAGRLRDVRYGLGGYKYQTNIKYLLPKETITSEFRWFVGHLADGRYQYLRLRRFFDNLDSSNYVASESKGYTRAGQALRLVWRSRSAMMLLAKRLSLFAVRPKNLWFFLAAVVLILSRKHIRNRWLYFRMWFVLWTTVILRYQGISDSDFEIESTSETMSAALLLPQGYAGVTDEPIPEQKVAAQQRYTIKALERAIAERQQAFGTHG